MAPTLLAIATLDLAPIFWLGALLGEVAFLFAVAANNVGRVLRLSALGSFVSLLPTRR